MRRRRLFGCTISGVLEYRLSDCHIVILGSSTMEHFDRTSIPKLFVIPSTNHTMSNGETSTAESTEVTGSTTACSSVSATTSETKRMGKFKFLTIPSASENSSSQPLSSETVSSSSPHRKYIVEGDLSRWEPELCQVILRF